MGSLPLNKQNGQNFHLSDTHLKNTANELETFLQKKHHLNTKTFATDVMFSHELKANNLVEGYTDDLNVVKEIINRRYNNLNQEQVRRIRNLYHGYNYILKETEINKETLRKLYRILSKDLLDEYEEKNMGEYYRLEKVYILISGILSRTPSEGIEASRIDEFMNKYFTFLHHYNLGSTTTDEYIKSQILHLYFVYIQ